MTYGLHKSTAFWSNHEARLDALATRFLARVHGVDPGEMPKQKGHKKVDAYSDALRRRLGVEYDDITRLRKTGRVPERVTWMDVVRDN